MALNDLIDVGVFSGTKEHLKPLHMEKQWFRTDSSTVVFVVDEKPTFAGIDPYNKLIDRNPEDNLIAVKNKSRPRTPRRLSYLCVMVKTPSHAAGGASNR